MIENISFLSPNLLKYWLVWFGFTFPYILFHSWKKKFLNQKGKIEHEKPLAARPRLNKYAQSKWRILETRSQTDQGKSDGPENGTNKIN